MEIAIARRAAFQFHDSISKIRLAGWSRSRASTGEPSLRINVIELASFKFPIIGAPPRRSGSGEHLPRRPLGRPAHFDAMRLFVGVLCPKTQRLPCGSLFHAQPS